MPSVAKMLLLIPLAMVLQASGATAYYRYIYPNKNVVFDRHSYENGSRVFAVCEEPGRQRVSRETRCDVNQVDDGGRARQCNIGLIANRRGASGLKPGALQVLRFGPDKAILSWVDPSLGLADKWRVSVLRFEDCSLHEPDTRHLRGLRPVSFVVYDRWFVVVVNSESGKCQAPSGRAANVPRCWLGMNDRGQVIGGPFPWFQQATRDDDMILVPLEHESPEAGHLLIDTFPKQRQTLARISIVQADGSIVTLRNYTVLGDDSPDVDPYERIAYSTRNNYIGVCVKNAGRNKVLSCSQWDRLGRLNLDTTFEVEHRHFHEFAVMNLAGYGGMLMLTSDCEDAACRTSGKNRHYVSRLGSDGSLGGGSYMFDKYECDRRLNRADGQIYELPGMPGQYCFAHVCYEDFFTNDYKDPDQRRTKEFKFDTNCFSENELRQSNKQIDQDGTQTLYTRYFSRWFVQ